MAHSKPNLRPLSPHLGIYSLLPTMVMSILHRITGAALYIGTIFLAWWLIALSSGEAAYTTVSWFFDSFFGRLILFGYTWALMHHLLGGLRHFLWDTGAGLEKTFATKLAWATIAGSISLTLILWIIAYIVR